MWAMVQAYAKNGWLKAGGFCMRLQVAVLLLPVAALLMAGNGFAQETTTGGNGCQSFLAFLGSEFQASELRSSRQESPCTDGILDVTFAGGPDRTQLDLKQVTEMVRDQHGFFGLAGFYAGVSEIILGANGVASNPSAGTAISDGSWFVVTGRFNVLGIRATGATLIVSEDQTALEWQESTSLNLRFAYGEKQSVAERYSEFEAVRYSQLWNWLRAMSKIVERALEGIQSIFNLHWGLAIIVLAIALKILLLPIGFMTVRFQRMVSDHQKVLEPQLRKIKDEYDGEEAHKRIMKAHRDLGVTPFFSLKPMIGSLIQVPVLVAVFNALGEMPQMIDSDFLWAGSLAYPDSVASLPFAIPLLGDTINLLPIVMTIVTVFSTVIYDNSRAPRTVVIAQKRQLYFMAAAFFVLFYPFPAAMVLYWTAANVLQFFQQQFLRV